MMGQLSGVQGQLFYEFNLERHVPSNHLLRGIDRFLDLGELRKNLADAYSPIGRPSIDPELMIRMLILGYCFGIRSERRLCEEVHLNLAYRWFCRLDLEDDVPDHSSFSKNRHGRFRENDIFRRVFETVLRRCMAEGLVRGEGFAADASIIRADAQRQRKTAEDAEVNWGDPEQAARPIREYLAGLEEANDLQQIPKPRVLSLTDPAATWTAAAGDPAFFAYSTNYLIDLANGIIVDVAATAVSKKAEVAATKAMVDRVEETFGLKPDRLVGDSSYGSADMLAWLVDEKQIEPHVPVWDKSERKDGTFSSRDFEWDGQANEYRCPNGKDLRCDRRQFQQPRTRITKADTLIYRASTQDCSVCPLKERCCPNTPFRKIHRSIHEDARDVARRLAMTDRYQQSCKDRKKVEMLFAHLKRILGMRKLRLRGFAGAKDEFLLAATAQNLRKMAKKLAVNTPETLAIAA